MNQKEYIKLALRSESENYKFIGTGKVTPRIEHAIYGVVTEAGELMGAIKKAKIYGQDLDRVNLIEEMGDLMWYLALLSDDLGVDFEDLWKENIEKLEARYPEKYTDELAINRNVKNEREILEKP